MWPFSFSDAPKALPPPPKKYEVGKAHITIHSKPVDGSARQWQFTYEGYAFKHGDYISTTSSYSLVANWHKECKNGLLYAGDGIYIPLLNIDRVEIVHEKFQTVAR